ncbi:uncharacterized protein [Asterias amurensis]|uniref:uncharacterized protein n=1 Tax=Asterias amurensis TaxID=7602 RepID=UPI003AB3122D
MGDFGTLVGSRLSRGRKTGASREKAPYHNRRKSTHNSTLLFLSRDCTRVTVVRGNSFIQDRKLTWLNCSNGWLRDSVTGDPFFLFSKVCLGDKVVEYDCAWRGGLLLINFMPSRLQSIYLKEQLPKLMSVSSDPADLYQGTKKYINVIGGTTESEIMEIPNMMRDKQL